MKNENYRLALVTKSYNFNKGRYFNNKSIIKRILNTEYLLMITRGNFYSSNNYPFQFFYLNPSFEGQT